MIPNPLILHVEDDDATAYLLQVAFRQQNLQIDVIRLCNGDDAASFLERNGVYCNAPQPDLVLLDLNLGKRNGHELLEIIREKPAFVQLPVIILSAATDDTNRQRALSGGANAYLVKPSDFDGYFSVTRTILEHLPRRQSHGA